MGTEGHSDVQLGASEVVEAPAHGDQQQKGEHHGLRDCVHEQVDDVEQQIVGPLEQVNQITEAAPNQAGDVGPHCPEQDHLGVVGVVLELSP